MEADPPAGISLCTFQQNNDSGAIRLTKNCFPYIFVGPVNMHLFVSINREKLQQHDSKQDQVFDLKMDHLFHEYKLKEKHHSQKEV